MGSRCRGKGEIEKWELVNCNLSTNGDGIEEENKPKREDVNNETSVENTTCREGAGVRELLMPKCRWDAQQPSNTPSVC